MLSRLVSNSGRFCRSFARMHAPQIHVSQTRSIGDPISATSLVVQHGVAKAAEIAAESGWRAISDMINKDKEFFSRKADVVKYFDSTIQSGKVAPLLSSRESLRDELVGDITRVCRLPGHFSMVAGPKGIGKSTIFFSVAEQLAMMDEYAPMWIVCDPDEQTFADSWKRSFGLSHHGGDNFVAIANIVLEGREGLRRLISREQEITENLYDSVLRTALAHVEVPEDVTTIVFVDQLQSSFNYISRLEAMVRKHSDHPKISYVLIASDAVDSYRIQSRRERRCHTIRMTPFNEEMMTESLMLFLKSRDVSAVHDECVELAQVIQSYTWETTQAHFFINEAIDSSGDAPRLDKKRMVEVAKQYTEDNAGVIRRDLDWEDFSKYSKVLKLIDDKGRIPIKEYRRLGNPEELIRVNCAYDDWAFLYISPEARKSFALLASL